MTGTIVPVDGGCTATFAGSDIQTVYDPNSYISPLGATANGAIVTGAARTPPVRYSCVHPFRQLGWAKRFCYCCTEPQQVLVPVAAAGDSVARL
jgi:hypothetical protein